MTTQAPIHSGFGARTEAREVVGDVAGKIAIVTGGAAGIGLETTKALRDAGATVVTATRADGFDLMNPASIDAFAQKFLATHDKLHMLICNAGIMAPPLTRDARGYESQFSTNHLGHFQLAARLWPALVKANGARVVAVSSRGHRYGKFDPEDTMFERRAYDKWVGYGQSKTANCLFALELDRRGQKHGVRAFSLHPGAIDTELSKHIRGPELDGMRARIKNGFKSPAAGAATSVWCASNKQLDGMGGVYCEDCDIAIAVDEQDVATEVGGPTMGVRPWARDAGAAAQLWTASERWTVAFPT